MIQKLVCPVCGYIYHPFSDEVIYEPLLCGGGFLIDGPGADQGTWMPSHPATAMRVWHEETRRERVVVSA